MKKGQTLKEEGNALVKKGEHKRAIEKYGQSIKHNPTEITTYTNRWVSAPRLLLGSAPRLLLPRGNELFSNYRYSRH